MSAETAKILVRKNKEKCVVSITIDTSEIDSLMDSEKGKLKEDIVRACVNFAHIIAGSCHGAYVSHDAVRVLSNLETEKLRVKPNGYEIQLGCNIGGAWDAMQDARKKAERDRRFSRSQKRKLKRIGEIFNSLISELRFLNRVEAKQQDKEYCRAFRHEIFNFLSELGFLEQAEAELKAFRKAQQLQAMETQKNVGGSLSDKWR